MARSHPKTGVFAKAFLVASIMVITTACTSDYADVRYVLKPSAPDSWMRINESIKLKSEALPKPPESFMSEAQPCVSSALGSIMGGRTDVSLAPEGSLIFQVKIRNDSYHVAKLLSSEVTLFDPQGNRYSALDREKMKLHFMSDHGCADSPSLNLQFANLKLVDGKLKILPGRANKGYVVFKPKDIKMPGAWSMSFFDMAAFSVKHLENAEPKTLTYKFTLNKFADVYTKDNWFDAATAKTTKDLTRGGGADEAIKEVQTDKDAARAAAEKARIDQEASDEAAEKAAEKARADAAQAAAQAEKRTADKAALNAALEKKLAAEKALEDAAKNLAEKRALVEATEKRAIERLALDKLADILAAEKFAAVKIAARKAAAEKAEKALSKKTAAVKAEKALSKKAAALKSAADKAVAAAKKAAEEAAKAKKAAQAAAAEQAKIARTADNSK